MAAAGIGRATVLIEDRVDGPPPAEGGTTMTASIDAQFNGYTSVEVDLRKVLLDGVGVG